jgi:hypothetical protein
MVSAGSVADTTAEGVRHDGWAQRLRAIHG